MDPPQTHPAAAGWQSAVLQAYSEGPYLTGVAERGLAGGVRDEGLGGLA